jgi:O-acetyl-ADP-ribose deacetylase (regulator of RNase III)
MNDVDWLKVGRQGRVSAWIELRVGDITKTRAEAIVNAANDELAGGGGVDGAIHDAAGPEVAIELRERYDGCRTGSAVISGPGRLAEHGVRAIIHAVGPMWRGGAHGEADLLRSAYQAALALADASGMRSVAFPAISAGIYAYPLDQAAAVATRAVRDGLADAESIDRAIFVLFGRDVLREFEQALTKVAGAL